MMSEQRRPTGEEIVAAGGDVRNAIFALDEAAREYVWAVVGRRDTTAALNARDAAIDALIIAIAARVKEAQQQDGKEKPVHG